MIINQPITTELEQIMRQIGAEVELYDGSTSTLTNTFSNRDSIKEFKIERIGKGKFFGYGFNQKLEIKFIDKDRLLNFIEDDYFIVKYEINSLKVTPHPTFYISEIKRDENTGEVTVTAYDRIKAAAAHKVSEIQTTQTMAEGEEDTGYTIIDFANRIAEFLGFDSIVVLNAPEEANPFELDYPEGANFEGTETLREALDAIAEATQTIYFVNNSNQLVFKRLGKDAAADYTLSKDRYFTLESHNERSLEAIVSATELGDDVGVGEGTTQYVRDNPFWELREDIAAVLDNALASIGGLNITPFKCEWRGNYLVEIGDKLEIVGKDDTTFNTFLLNDTLTYNGALKQVSEWEYEENENESSSNANTLGQALKQTYAKVDKANKQIDLVASESKANSESIAALSLNTEAINLSVQKMEQVNQESMDAINGEITKLTEKVDLAITSEQLDITIKNTLENGVTKVETNTGFKFDDTGLTVSKTNSEMSTTITEDGMTVYKDNEEMLVANNKGVNAKNLHAETYLIIGTNSRFEDYDGNRTGCFWIGGN